MYLYQKLREAVGMPKNSAMQIRNWTPNNIKAIVVSRYFIVVAHHTSVPKVVALNAEEAVKDIQNNGVGGSLHNLLSQKQLSCLEEIYVDSVFMNYKGIFDLDKYVATLVNNASRLRYYGYADISSCDEVANFYRDGVVQSRADYTYALFKERRSAVQYQSTGNEQSWHNKFNLRPEKYYLDSPKLQLSILLKRIQSKIEESRLEETKRLAEQGMNECLKVLFMQDLSNINNLMCLLKLKNKLTATRLKKDEVGRRVKSIMQEFMTKQPEIKVAQADLQKALSNSVNLSKGSKEEFLVKYYAEKHILTKEETKLKLEELTEIAKSSGGLLGLPMLLRNICRKIVKSSNGSSDIIQFSCYMLLSLDEVESCDGNLEGLIQSKLGTPDCVAWYTDFILGLCGFNRSNL